MPNRPQYSPYQAAHDSPLLDDKRKQNVQQVIGSILYYERAVDKTTLPALSSIVSKQAKAMEMTEVTCMQLLDYLTTHPDAITVSFLTSAMI